MATAVGGGRLDETSSGTTTVLGWRRAAAEARARMSAEEYLSAHDVRGVLLNALRHVQRACAGDADTVRHIEAAAEYFHSVATARHVVGMSFQEVTATARDVAAFHVNARRVLQAMGSELKNATAPAEDWHEILLLLCPDLPFGVTRLAVRAACEDDRDLENAEASAAALAPALRVAVERWRFLHRALADAFAGHTRTPHSAERCLETLTDVNGFAETTDDSDATREFRTCVRESFAAATKPTKTNEAETNEATHDAFAVAMCRHPRLRADATRACEAAARRAEAAEAAAAARDTG